MVALVTDKLCKLVRSDIKTYSAGALKVLHNSDYCPKGSVFK